MSKAVSIPDMQQAHSVFIHVSVERIFFVTVDRQFCLQLAPRVSSICGFAALVDGQLPS